MANEWKEVKVGNMPEDFKRNGEVSTPACEVYTVSEDDKHFDFRLFDGERWIWDDFQYAPDQDKWIEPTHWRFIEE